MSKKGCPVCPEVKVDMSEVVDQVKREIMGDEAPAAEVNTMGLRVIPQSLNGNQFLLGYITLPTAINFSSKLIEAGVMPFLGKIDQAYTRSGAAVLTLAIHMLTGGKSFLLGAFMGQLPTTLDKLADLAVNAYQRSRIVSQAPAAQTAIAGVDEELLKLRQELNTVQMSGGRELAGVGGRNGGGPRFSY